MSTAPNGVPTPVPIGRPAGSRNRLSKRIIEDIATTWGESGIECLRILAKEDPATFAKLAVSTLPKDILLGIEQRAPGGLSVEEWALLQRVLDVVKANIAAEASPMDVFGTIEEALRARYALPVNG